VEQRRRTGTSGVARRGLLDLVERHHLGGERVARSITDGSFSKAHVDVETTGVWSEGVTKCGTLITIRTTTAYSNVLFLRLVTGRVYMHN